MQAPSDTATLASHSRCPTALALAGHMSGQSAEADGDGISVRASAETAGLAKPRLDALTPSVEASRHRFHVACDPDLRLTAETLDRVCAIAGEALSNAVRHAFPDGRDGDIWLGLVQDRDRLKLTIRDNGVGMTDLPAGQTGGRGRIEDLAHQLGGYARLGSTAYRGGEVSVVFPHRIENL